MASSPSFEILDHAETPLGVLCLRRRELRGRPGTWVTEVTLDHEFLMSSYHTESERALAERPLAWHGGTDLQVLVGGLGLGYTAQTALASDQVAGVVVVELLPQVLRWFEDGLVPLAAALGSDPRLRVERGDIFARLSGAAPSPLPDLVLIDVDHSPAEVLRPAHRDFYTVSGLRRAAQALTPGGVLAVWSSSENAAFGRALEAVFAEVRVERVEWHNELVDCDQVDELFLARV